MKEFDTNCDGALDYVEFVGRCLHSSTVQLNTRPLFSSTQAVLVTPPRVPLSNRLGGNHAPNVPHKMCLH